MRILLLLDKKIVDCRNALKQYLEMSMMSMPINGSKMHDQGMEAERMIDMKKFVAKGELLSTVCPLSLDDMLGKPQVKLQVLWFTCVVVAKLDSYS